MLTVQDTQKALSEGVDKLSQRKGKGKSEQDYLKHGAVALAMNTAFGSLGWDSVTEKIEILRPAYKCNSGGSEDPAGAYWSAMAYALVTVRGRSLFRPDGTFTEVVRTCVGVGQAVSGKTNTQFDAIQNAITSAETAAFKRACRYFGPSTGLTLQFEPGEREQIETAMKAISTAEDIRVNGDAAIEGSDETPAAPQTQSQSVQSTPQTQVQQQIFTQPANATPSPTASPAATAAPNTSVAPAPASATTAQASSGIPECLKSLGDQAVLARIAALPTNESPVSADDVKAFQITLVATFGPHAAKGIWTTAGLSFGPGSAVTKAGMKSVADVLEQAAVGIGGMEGFLAKFKPAAPASATTPPASATTPPASATTPPASATTPPASATTPPASATTPTATPAAAPAAAAGTAATTAQAASVQGPTSTVEMKGQHVAGAPSTPAPANGMTHGQEVQAAWDQSSLLVSERRARYSKLFEGFPPDVITLLSETPDEGEITAEGASKIHAVGLTIYQRLNMAASVFEVWKKIGYEFGKGQPRGKHIRAFVAELPT